MTEELDSSSLHSIGMEVPHPDPFDYAQGRLFPIRLGKGDSPRTIKMVGMSGISTSFTLILTFFHRRRDSNYPILTFPIGGEGITMPVRDAPFDRLSEDRGYGLKADTWPEHASLSDISIGPK